MNDNPQSAAITAAMNSDWKTAITLNAAILKNTPDDVDTLNRLGRAYIEIGDYKKALTHFKKVLKIDKYHPIALKNIERLESIDKRKTSIEPNMTQRTYCDFIEEPGKTKVVGLVNIAPTKIVSTLRPATSVILKPRRHTLIVCLDDSEQTYIGALPDDLGHRMEIFLEGGNTYEAYIKSANGAHITVFLREVSRGKKYANILSFSTSYPDKTNPSVDMTMDEKESEKTVKNDDDDEETPSRSQNLHADEEPDV